MDSFFTPTAVRAFEAGLLFCPVSGIDVRFSSLMHLAAGVFLVSRFPFPLRDELPSLSLASVSPNPVSRPSATAGSGAEVLGLVTLCGLLGSSHAAAEPCACRFVCLFAAAVVPVLAFARARLGVFFGRSAESSSEPQFSSNLLAFRDTAEEVWQSLSRGSAGTIAPPLGVVSARDAQDLLARGEGDGRRCDMSCLGTSRARAIRERRAAPSSDVVCELA